MPTLGREFLQSLANPPLNEGLFNLGASIGGIPGQYQAKKKEETAQANNLNLMQGIQNQDPTVLFEAAKARNANGDTAGAVQLVKYAQELQAKQKSKEDQQKLATFATKSGTKLRDPQVRQEFFLLGKQANLSVEETDKLYRMFLDQYASNKEIQKAGDVRTRVNSKREYEGYQVVTYKDGTSKEIVFPYPEGTVPASSSSGGNVQQQLRDKIDEEERAAGRLALADKMRPGNVLAEQSAKDFATIRVEAVTKLPDLRDSVGNLKEIKTLLKSPDFATGGFTRQVARKFTKFLGTEPANVGEFETRIGEVVLAKLEVFTGAISEGERNFLIEQVGNYLNSGESNLGRLIPLLERAEQLFNNSMLIARSPSFESYLNKVAPAEEETTSDLNYSVFPAAKQQEIQQAVENGDITYETALEFYK